jgi:[acyl-carrier-protein] S-malonyltransferase
MEACQAAGARRAVLLPVSAPFHCALMAPAQERMAADLARIAFRDPEVPLVNNVDARMVRSADECREGLVRQVSAPVRWQQSVEAMAQDGVTTFVEVGPGTVLTGLIKKINKRAEVLNAEDPASLEKAALALAGVSRAEA